MAKFIASTNRWGNTGLKQGVIYLTLSTWNDYQFRTLFNVVYTDIYGKFHDIGQIKIGFVGQDEDTPTLERIPTAFSKLHSDFFSLAESPDFYVNLFRLGEDFCHDVLESLNCVVINNKAMLTARSEVVFIKSLARHVHMTTALAQFRRIIKGDSELTEFDFRFVRDNSIYSDIYLDFSVMPESLPPTNIHTIIGRNGLGKTTLLNEMINSIMLCNEHKGGFFEDPSAGRIKNDYFSAVISIAFSAFDPFRPLKEQGDRNRGTCYYYIGLQDGPSHIDGVYASGDIRKLHERCAEAIFDCCADSSKYKLWCDAIRDLESDDNFKELDLIEISKFPGHEVIRQTIKRLRDMSSGHAIVFITITILIQKLQEKTLVLFDEPESHLHPPLLSALIRVMSNLLNRRNGIAIIATHSPVVVQEVPKSCCWLLSRFGEITTYTRPTIETFAENVGTLTKEVFKLEMEQSGYHKLLKKKVDAGLTYEKVIEAFKGKIGFEGRAVLMSMIMLRDKGVEAKNNHQGEGEDD